MNDVPQRPRAAFAMRRLRPPAPLAAVLHRDAHAHGQAQATVVSAPTRRLFLPLAISRSGVARARRSGTAILAPLSGEAPNPLCRCFRPGLRGGQ